MPRKSRIVAAPCQSHQASRTTVINKMVIGKYGMIKCSAGPYDLKTMMNYDVTIHFSLILWTQNVHVTTKISVSFIIIQFRTEHSCAPACGNWSWMEWETGNRSEFKLAKDHFGGQK